VSSKDAGFYQVTGQSHGRRRARRGWQVTGVDIGPKALRTARERARGGRCRGAGAGESLSRPWGPLPQSRSRRIDRALARAASVSSSSTFHVCRPPSLQCTVRSRVEPQTARPPSRAMTAARRRRRQRRSFPVSSGWRACGRRPAAGIAGTDQTGCTERSIIDLYRPSEAGERAAARAGSSPRQLLEPASVGSNH
jgi:hypothetical protein